MKAYIKANGYALVFVIMLMIVVSLLFLATNTIVNLNTKETAYEKDQLKAYYLARSGIDIAYAALTENEKIRVIDEDTEVKEEQLQLDQGYVNLSIKREKNRFVISSKGVLNTSSVQSQLILYVDKDDIEKVTWGD